MAFMNRGDIPSMDKDSIQDRNDYDDYSHYRYRQRYGYYIPLDNTYVVMEMIVTFLILIVGSITFFATYKSTIIDPIEGVKKLFINSHLIIIGICLVTTLMINFFSKSKTLLLKRLGVISVVSMIIMLVFLGIKLNLDVTYTKNRFEQFFMEQNIQDDSNTKSRVNIGINGVSIKTEKEYYIDECMKLYNIFKVKTYGTLGLQLLLNILLIYQIVRMIKIEEKKDKMNKDDLILFDEEQNVRF